MSVIRGSTPSGKVSVSGPGHRACGEKRSAQVRRAAARAADEPRGRALQRREPRAGDAVVATFERDRPLGEQGAQQIDLLAQPPALIEMDWGQWEGHRLADLRRRHGSRMSEMEALGLDLLPPGGESPGDPGRGCRWR